MRFSPQTMALAAIGIADLVSTLLFVGLANAAEANPLMARFLEQGPAPFIAAKLLLLAVPLVVLELARPKRPRFVGKAANAAIVAYVSLYIFGVAHVNAREHRQVQFMAADTQAHIDQRREVLGLPPAPPLTLLVRAEQQRKRGSVSAVPSASRVGAAEKRASAKPVMPAMDVATDLPM